jgi:hypothetical protein
MNEDANNLDVLTSEVCILRIRDRSHTSQSEKGRYRGQTQDTSRGRESVVAMLTCEERG